MDNFNMSTVDVDGGYDIVVSLVDGHHIAAIQQDDDVVTIRVRDERMPSIGETVMVEVAPGQRRPIIVRERRWDSDGRLWLVDRDTQAQYRFL